MKWALWLIALAGCSKLAVDLDGRPCVAGECSTGYVCHPELGRCAPEVRVGCGAPNAVCPEGITTGSTCEHVGSFIPCDSSSVACDGGCRTCTPSGWGECSDATTCDLGRPESCARCDHDCRVEVQNAVAICESGGGGNTCGYVGGCTLGFADRNEDPGDGCECEITNGGVELCDGVDNNCDGETDENDGDCDGETPVCRAAACDCGPASCNAGRYCASNGDCTACGLSDALHCGVTCATCSGVAPVCVDGSCTCAGDSCGAGSWCSDIGCITCGDTDPQHCGEACAVCGGTTPLCDSGACKCSSTSCPSGQRCDASGACVPCNDAAHCGPACGACGAGHNVCNALTGACTCTPGSCPSGSYCAAGTCTPCGCSVAFPTCTDTGGAPSCTCTASSCGLAGVCGGAGKQCRYTYDFNASEGFEECGFTGINLSSWDWGAAGGMACRSGSCWATTASGNYNRCEQSCIGSPAFPLAGVTGTIDVSFWAAYQYEYGTQGAWDGATVRINRNDGQQMSPAPVGGWDTAQIRLGQSSGNNCGFTFMTAPGWGQYGGSPAAHGWEQERFVLTGAEWFHNNFSFRIWNLSDVGVEADGIYIDDVEVLVTQSP
jgi:hypothetical protein